jgi:hypothetical protein
MATTPFIAVFCPMAGLPLQYGLDEQKAHENRNCQNQNRGKYLTY